MSSRSPTSAVARMENPESGRGRRENPGRTVLERTDTHSRIPRSVRIATRLGKIARYKWLIGIAVFIFGADRATKIWIHNTLPFGAYHSPENIEVIPGFFHIVHLGNTGAAWGILPGMSFWLGLLAAGALAAIFLFRRYLHLDLIAVQISFGFLVGGILGNLIDRLLHGHVIDFLDFHFGTFTWPAFNVADAGICIGVGIYIVLSFLHPRSLERERE